MNPFIQDHHCIQKTAYIGGAGVPVESYPAQAAPPLPSLPDPTSGMRDILKQNFGKALSQYWGHEAANQWNTQLNSMSTWDKLRMLFMRGLGGLLNTFGIKNKFNEPWQKVNQRVAAATIERLTGQKVNTSHLGGLDRWTDLEKGMSSLLKDESDTPFRRTFQPYYDNMTQALEKYTAERGRQEAGGFKLPLTDLDDQFRVFNKTKEDSEYAKSFFGDAFNPMAEHNVYKHLAPDQKILMNADYARQFHTEPRKVKPSGFIGGLMDGNVWNAWDTPSYDTNAPWEG